jgi:tetratricopeptide (TPR) repeat protein
LNEAIRLDPSYAFAYDNRGIGYAAKGEHDRAIADHSEAVRIDPGYAVAYNNRGDAYRRKDDNDRAIDASCTEPRTLLVGFWAQPVLRCFGYVT